VLMRDALAEGRAVPVARRQLSVARCPLQVVLCSLFFVQRFSVLRFSVLRFFIFNSPFSIFNSRPVL